MQGIFLALIIGLAAVQAERIYSQSNSLYEQYDGQQDMQARTETQSSKVRSHRSTYRNSQPASAFILQYPGKTAEADQPLLQAYSPHVTAFADGNLVWDSTTSTGPYQNNRQPIAAASAFQNPQSVRINNKNYNTELFQSVVRAYPEYNVVFSPISLQLLLAFLAIGANGNTYDQLKFALGLPNRLEADKNFGNLRQSLLQPRAAQLIMANKMYFSNRQRLHPAIHERAMYYGAEVEAIDFNSPPAAASSINYWVSLKTHNIIPQLVSPAQLDVQTQAMLVGAIHFKGKWAKEFSTRDTEKHNFYVTPTRTVLVDMMYTDDTFRYGEFPELDADGLELQYENSDISMMILLPKKRNGLAEMEQRLRSTDLNSLSARMQAETVTLRLPKFRVEFELDMRRALEELGINDIFTSHADLRGCFSGQQVRVSQVQHKAFLDVSEAGSEEAAASFIKQIPLSLPNRIIEFTVHHPFMFAIRRPQAVLFIGHVVNIQ